MKLSLDDNLVLAAGAGSGKTHALVTVALGLYAGAAGRKPMDPTRVWAVTFTEKAAAELRQRIADRALRLAHGGGNLEKEPELAALLGERRPTPGEWAQIARALSAAPVGTFHSLCAQLLRNFASDAGLDPGFTILDERESRLLFERAREEAILVRVGEEGALRRLARELGTLDQVRSAIGMLSGKLAEEGLEPAALVDNPAFDLAAARARLGDACGALHQALALIEPLDHPRLQDAIGTLRRERERIGRCLPDEIERWYPLVAAVCGAKPGNLAKAIREPWNVAKGAWEQVQSAWASVRQASVAADLVEAVEAVAGAYQAEKDRLGALDFSDLVRRTRDLLRDDPSVRREAKRRISALLVDEFQDTNGVQLDLVRLLAEARDQERPVEAGASCAELPLEPAIFCAVGDRKQSIYEFRGADVSLFSELTDKARRGEGMRLEALRHSWRSRPGLVRFANALFEQVLASRVDPFEVGWLDVDPLEPKRPEDDEAYVDRPAVQLLLTEPKLKVEERLPLETARVADHVASLLASGMQVREKNGDVRPLVGADIALLLRKTRDIGPYQRALEDRRIPTLVVGGRGFYAAREIRDLGALLLALCDPWDRFASAAVWRSPLVGLSDDGLTLLAAQGALELGRHREGCAAELPATDAERVQRIGPLVHRLSKEVDRLGPAGVLRLAIDALDLRPLWAAAPRGEQRLANVEKLLDLLEERRGLGALAAAEEILSRADDEDDREEPADVAAFADGNAVRLLTVHASKGLEFPVVVLPELGVGPHSGNDAVFYDRTLGLAVKVTDPLQQRIGDEHQKAVVEQLARRELAESRRLFYVAATRARDLLVLCGEQGARGGRNSWRDWLDGAMTEEIEALIERVEMPPARASAAVAEGRDASAEVPGGSDPVDPAVRAEAEQLLAGLQPVSLAPGRFVAAVTELAELERCERRYFYKIIAGLEELPHGGPLAEIAEADEADLPGIDRLARGQLAHRILELVDWERVRSDPAAAVQEIVEAEGLDGTQPEVAAIAADTRAFLESPLGQKLASTPAERIYRELPFALVLQGAAGSELALRGQIDLLFLDDQGVAHLIDYKHASGRGQDPDAYGFQLRTYALAAARILPGDRPMQVGIVWLRDRKAAPSLQTVERQELAAHEAKVAALGDALSAARAAGAWRKLEGPAHCGGCGFRFRCWGTNG